MKSKQLQFKIKQKGPGRRSGTKAHLIFKKGVYGGALKHRKHARPFDSTKAVHTILRSQLLSGSRSLLKSNRKQWTEKLIREKARRYKAKLYTFSINSNHIHLLMKFHAAEDQQNFLRDLAGSLALKIKRAFKIKKEIKVWDARPFSSIVRSFPRIKEYIEKNKNEASGLWPYQERPTSFIEKVLSRIQFAKNQKISTA